MMLRNDIANVYRAICQTFGAGRYIIFIVVIVASVLVLLPQNQYLEEVYRLKEELGFNLGQGLGNMLQKLSPSSESSEILDYYKRELQKTRGQVIERELRIKELTGAQQFFRYIPAQFTFHAVRVIKVSESTLENTAYISGGADKLAVGDIVIDENTIVGRVVATYNNFSKILLASDPQFKVPVMGVKTGNEYIVTGAGRRNVLDIEFIGQTVAPIEEEALVTSGVGGVFPQGLKVGELSEARNKFMVKRQVDFSKNPYVFVVR
jgi:cell shape-determining protein MreC